MNSILHQQSFYNHIENIYDTHAAVMYGCIYKIVQDKIMAEKILASIFEDFCKDYSSDVQTKTAPIWFIKYAMKRTFTYLKMEDENNHLSSLITERIVSLKKDIHAGFSASA